jgi:hypothetical protein
MLGKMPDWDNVEGLRFIGPRHVIGAFAAELYFKCILVDAGAKTFPATHNLLELFTNLPRPIRENLGKRWRQYLAVLGPASTVMTEKHPEMLGMTDFVTRHANAFEEWRYRFETPIPDVKQASSGFVHLFIVFRDYLLDKHPDWDDWVKHWISTFPAL